MSVNLLPSSLDNVTEICIFENSGFIIPYLPFALTGEGHISNLSPEAPASEHVRCQGGSNNKLVWRNAATMQMGTNFSIDVQYVDPSYQTILYKIKDIAADIARNRVTVINKYLLSIDYLEQVNIEGYGSRDSAARLMPTAITGNGNRSARFDLSAISGIIASLNLLAADRVKLYKEFVQGFKEKALENDGIILYNGEPVNILG